MFRLKRFSIEDQGCAMKVGTDGVLLGAWWRDANDNLSDGVDPFNERDNRLLDIGTGSGLVAMMVAQRSLGPIDAIDIDADAAHQAAANFLNTPWSERLTSYHSSLQSWAQRCQQADICYRAIFSNPPYFTESLKNPDAQRRLARHTDTLSYEELVGCADRLLAEEGNLTLILPIEAEEEIIHLGARYHLYPARLCRIKGTARKAYKRLLIEFRRQRADLVREEELVLLDTTGARSEAYASLCQDYYL